MHKANIKVFKIWYLNTWILSDMEIFYFFCTTLSCVVSLFFKWNIRIYLQSKIQFVLWDRVFLFTTYCIIFFKTLESALKKYIAQRLIFGSLKKKKYAIFVEILLTIPVWNSYGKMPILSLHKNLSLNNKFKNHCS